jgi:hypothetical protein
MRRGRKSRQGGGRQPVFLLGFHRGGTTFVQRLLNCHREVTIWGENGALLSNLRLVHETFGRYGHKLDPRAYSNFNRFADQFEPWASPVTSEELLRHISDFVASLYDVARASTVWGFKEVNHGNGVDVGFIRRLFPDALVILLVREPRELFLSDLHTEWSDAPLTSLSPYAEEFSLHYLETIERFIAAVEDAPTAVRMLAYEQFRDRDLLPDVFSWMGLGDEGLDRRLVEQVRRTRRGSAYSDVGRYLPQDDVAEALSTFERSFASGLSEPLRSALEGFYPRFAGGDPPPS